MLPTAALSDQVTAVFVVFATVAVKAWVCEGLRLTLSGVNVTLTGVAGFNCRTNLSFTPPTFPASVTVCVVLTADTTAVKPALVAFGGTITVAGTVTAALLLDRLTIRPPLGAAALSVTVQASVPAPVSDALPHPSALNAVAFGLPL